MNSEERFKIFFPFAAQEWSKLGPKAFWGHYTSLKGAKGIIKSKEFWLRSPFFSAQS